MNVLFLSGNSLHNKDFAYKAKDELCESFDTFSILNYRHWESGEEWIDIEHELSQLPSVVPTTPYGVIAKSIGTALTMHAIERGVIKPKFLLLLGLPVEILQKKHQSFLTTLQSLDIPVTIVQNTYDPYGSFEVVQNYIGNLEHVRLIETKGTTHDYENYELLKKELKKLEAHTL